MTELNKQILIMLMICRPPEFSTVSIVGAENIVINSDLPLPQNTFVCIRASLTGSVLKLNRTLILVY